MTVITKKATIKRCNCRKKRKMKNKGIVFFSFTCYISRIRLYYFFLFFPGALSSTYEDISFCFLFLHHQTGLSQCDRLTKVTEWLGHTPTENGFLLHLANTTRSRSHLVFREIVVVIVVINQAGSYCTYYTLRSLRHKVK